jgi:hypothetical protein
MSSKDVSVGDALKDAPAEAAGMFGRLFARLISGSQVRILSGAPMFSMTSMLID